LKLTPGLLRHSRAGLRAWRHRWMSGYRAGVILQFASPRFVRAARCVCAVTARRVVRCRSSLISLPCKTQHPPSNSNPRSMKQFADENFDKLLLVALFACLIMLVLHMEHHQGDREQLSWAREQSGTVLGALLGLITGHALAKREPPEGKL